MELPLSGKFNVYNALAAVAVGMGLGMNFTQIVEALKEVHSVPGRFQLVSKGGQDFTVIVDYAHTPDGLANLLDSARDITVNQVSLVFGCGGDRDKTKRPIMGKIAAEKADWIFITNDNIFNFFSRFSTILYLLFIKFASNRNIFLKKNY